VWLIPLKSTVINLVGAIMIIFLLTILGVIGLIVSSIVILILLYAYAFSGVAPHGPQQAWEQISPILTIAFLVTLGCLLFLIWRFNFI
jgi:hypothetical protein